MWWEHPVFRLQRYEPVQCFGICSKCILFRILKFLKIISGKGWFPRKLSDSFSQNHYSIIFPSGKRAFFGTPQMLYSNKFINHVSLVINYTWYVNLRLSTGSRLMFISELPASYSAFCFLACIKYHIISKEWKVTLIIVGNYINGFIDTLNFSHGIYDEK